MASKVAHVVSIAVLCPLVSFGARTATAQTVLSIEVLSSRPDLVTSGDALVRVSGPQAPKVTVGGSDVSAGFRPDQTGRWVGLIEGLKNGANQLVAKAGGKEASVTLVNHPLNATLFAGPQQEPFICENQSHGLASSVDSYGWPILPLAVSLSRRSAAAISSRCWTTLPTRTAQSWLTGC